MEKEWVGLARAKFDGLEWTQRIILDVHVRFLLCAVTVCHVIPEVHALHADACESDRIVMDGGSEESRNIRWVMALGIKSVRVCCL